MNNPYRTLGVNENSTRQEIEDAYNSLKARYREERFLEGEAGAAAARKLSELEQAYIDCLSDLEKKVVIDETGSQFGNIADLIKAGDLNGAQQILDTIEFRDAEWHYYQSVIYYKRDWQTESMKQLEIACALEPTNEKYKKAREKMAEAGKKAEDTPNMNETRGGYAQPQPTPAGAATGACCDSCCMLMCCDSCCECMGGDLIGCC